VAEIIALSNTVCFIAFFPRSRLVTYRLIRIVIMPEREKIALCLEYPIEQFGGTEILVRELVHGLAKRYRITLVSGDNADAIKTTSVAGEYGRHISWNASELSVENSRRLAQALSDEGIKLAHFHFGGNYAWGNRYFNRSPILFLSRMGVPCMSTNHGAFSIFDGYCGPQRSVFVKGGLFLPAWFNKQRVLSHLQTEIAVSQHDYHALRRWYWPMCSKFGQIYHSQLHRSQLDGPAPLPAVARDKVIICVGTIGLRKGQAILADAFSRIAGDFPDWKLALIGRHGHQELVTDIRNIMVKFDLQKRILLLDNCSNDEVNHWMHTAAIFAMPSLFEGLGLSLQEALFHGCACIGSAAGGITDLLENDSNGILTERGNVEQLVQGLRKLMASESLREKFGREGRQSIIRKEMFAENMVEKYDQLYQKYRLAG
jgi:glycosyltransferase involved in cell wall biosynthesis